MPTLISSAPFGTVSLPTLDECRMDLRQVKLGFGCITNRAENLATVYKTTSNSNLITISVSYQSNIKISINGL